MSDSLISIAQTCLDGAERNAMRFPDIIGTLAEAGFEGYAIDFRSAVATYYPREGDPIPLPTHRTDPVAATFDAPALQAAIREAQQDAPGYTYVGFCRKAAAAGCAGYVVSFPGRRALYLGRTAETHIEHFPD